MKITVNRIKCLKCGDIITSESAHDNKSCSCGACSIDGGRQYLRRGGNRANWEELSVFAPDDGTDFEELFQAQLDEKLEEYYDRTKSIYGSELDSIQISDEVLNEVISELANRDN